MRYGIAGGSTVHHVAVGCIRMQYSAVESAVTSRIVQWSSVM